MAPRGHTVSAGDKDIPLRQGVGNQLPAQPGPPSSCVALGKPLPLSEPQFPHMSYLEVAYDREGVPGNSQNFRGSMGPATLSCEQKLCPVGLWGGEWMVS